MDELKDSENYLGVKSSTTKPCDVCGACILRTARFCPQCGASQSPTLEKSDGVEPFMPPHPQMNTTEEIRAAGTEALSPRTPATKAAFITLAILLPIFGVGAFLAVGHDQRNRELASNQTASSSNSQAQPSVESQTDSPVLTPEQQNKASTGSSSTDAAAANSQASDLRDPNDTASQADLVKSALHCAGLLPKQFADGREVEADILPGKDGQVGVILFGRTSLESVERVWEGNFTQMTIANKAIGWQSYNNGLKATLFLTPYRDGEISWSLQLPTMRVDGSEADMYLNGICSPALKLKAQ